jgi:hypothetical protein
LSDVVLENGPQTARIQLVRHAVHSDASEVVSADCRVVVYIHIRGKGRHRILARRQLELADLVVDRVGNPQRHVGLGGIGGDLERNTGDGIIASERADALSVAEAVDAVALDTASVVTQRSGDLGVGERGAVYILRRHGELLDVMCVFGRYIYLLTTARGQVEAVVAIQA